MALPPYQLITDAQSWGECLNYLVDEPRVAIDLEANSLYAYREQICLVQISIPDRDFILDPIAGFDFHELGDILIDPEIEKIFHAAEYDLILLKRQFEWDVANLFDTMWAARILGIARCGLANVLADYYGVKHNKRHQKANWCRRPLSPPQLTYAQIDTHYLLQLRKDLAASLEEKNSLGEALEIFQEQTKINLPTTSFDPNSFWNINGVRELTGQGQAVAKHLNIYRDQQARRQDRPPFKIFQDRTLVELAQAEPQKLADLDGIHGMSKGQIRRYGKRILGVVSEAQKAGVPRKPKRTNNRPPDDVTNRYEQLHAWRKDRAQNRGVESDVILSRDTLWALAANNPQSTNELAELELLGPWRTNRYGHEIIALLEDN